MLELARPLRRSCLKRYTSHVEELFYMGSAPVLIARKIEVVALNA